MTDKEIIKALENKINGSDYQCFEDNDVLNLIIYQQSEIERLKGELNHLKGSMTLVGCIKQSENNEG